MIKIGGYSVFGFVLVVFLTISFPLNSWAAAQPCETMQERSAPPCDHEPDKQPIQADTHSHFCLCCLSPLILTAEPDFNSSPIFQKPIRQNRLALFMLLYRVDKPPKAIRYLSV